MIKSYPPFAQPAQYHFIEHSPHHDDQARDFEIADLFRLIRRRKYWIGLITFIGTALFVLLSFTFPVQYKAKLTLLMERQESAASSTPAKLLGISNDDSPIAIEIALLRSRGVAQKIVQHLGLTHDPEFNPLFSLVHPKAITKAQPDFKLLPFSKFKSFSLDNTSPPVLPLSLADRALEETISKFRSLYSVKRLPTLPVILLEVTASDPVKAANIANKAAHFYVEHRQQQAIMNIQKARHWFEGKLEAIENDVRLYERKIIALEKQYLKQQGSSSEMSEKQLLNLSLSLTNARQAKLNLEQRIEALKSLKDTKHNAQVMGDVLKSPAIIRLKSQREALSQRYSELSTRYGPKHPQMKDIEASLDENERLTNHEIQLIIGNLVNEHHIAQQTVRSLEDEISQLSESTLTNLHLRMEILFLQNEIAAKNDMRASVMQAFEQQEASRLALQDLKILSYAAVPKGPESPRQRLIVILGAFLSFFTALAICLLTDRNDYRVLSSAQLERLTHLPCHGVIPHIENSSPDLLRQYIAKYPSSSLSESIRALRTVMAIHHPHRSKGEDKNAQVISITSSFADEGKTQLATWLAQSMAKAGARVILIDCDLRRPNVHKTLGYDNAASLVEYLTDQKPLNEVVEKDPSSNMFLIYARAVPGSAHDLIASPKMKTLIAALRHEYDYVILDTPPSLAASDAYIAAQLSDLVLYAVHWSKTSYQSALNGLRAYRPLKTPIATVLTRADFEKISRYGYGEKIEYYDDQAA